MNKTDSEEINLKYDSMGLIPVIVQDNSSDVILMMGYANEEALNVTIKDKVAVFWSRSRNELWKKGETSGNLMEIVDILVDCDQDTLIYKVKRLKGGACHTKNSKDKYRESCFYRKINMQDNKLINMDK